MFIHLLVCICQWLDHSFRCAFGSVPHLFTRALQIVMFFPGSIGLKSQLNILIMSSVENRQAKYIYFFQQFKFCRGFKPNHYRNHVLRFHYFISCENFCYISSTNLPEWFTNQVRINTVPLVNLLNLLLRTFFRTSYFFWKYGNNPFLSQYEGKMGFF